MNHEDVESAEPGEASPANKGDAGGAGVVAAPVNSCGAPADEGGAGDGFGAVLRP